MELWSGEVAAPTSPMAPARESGAISKKGTDVEIVFNSPSNVSKAVGDCAKELIFSRTPASTVKDIFLML